MYSKAFANLRASEDVQDRREYLASDMTEEEILEDFPDLTREDLKACIAFAADRERKLMTVPAA